LTVLLEKHSGRSHGKITVRHQGGRQKRYYRIIDFKRNKRGVEGVVSALEYDPNRNVDIALIKYSDGDLRYILAPKGLKVADKVISDENVEMRIGNASALKNLPVGTIVHNVELQAGKGGQLGRSAGTGIAIRAKEGKFAHLKMPSGEVRMVPLEAWATIGVLGNEEWKNMVLGKAGRARRPTRPRSRP
jgi:large subunit ribosomal protein L2